MDTTSSNDSAVQGNILRRNRIVCTRPGLMKAGIFVGAKVRSVTLDGNVVEGIACALEDLRPLQQEP